MRTQWQLVSGRYPPDAFKAHVGAAAASAREPRSWRGNRPSTPCGWLAGAADDSLVLLAVQSLRRGHWKVALRRMYMLLALDGSLPEWLVPQYRELCARYPERQRQGMRHAAADWAEFVKGRPGSPSSRAQ